MSINSYIVTKNLMGTCRAHHVEFGDKKESKHWLREVHLDFMNKNKKQ